MDQNQQPQQNQTPPPDYDFILNQGQPATGMPPQPKKRDKKVIILIILATVLVVVMVLWLIFGRESPEGGQNQASTTPTDNSETLADSNPNKKVAADFITHLVNQEYDQAYGLFGDSIAPQGSTESSGWFVGEVAPALASSFRLEACTVTDATPPTDNALEVSCPYKDSNEMLISTFEFNKSQPTPQIIKVSIKELRQL